MSGQRHLTLTLIRWAPTGTGNRLATVGLPERVSRPRAFPKSTGKDCELRVLLNHRRLRSIAELSAAGSHIQGDPWHWQADRRGNGKSRYARPRPVAPSRNSPIFNESVLTKLQPWRHRFFPATSPDNRWRLVTESSVHCAEGDSAATPFVCIRLTPHVLLQLPPVAAGISMPMEKKGMSAVSADDRPAMARDGPPKAAHDKTAGRHALSGILKPKDGY